VFIQYVEGTTWQPATENSLFSGDTLVFPGSEPVKLAGEDPGDWIKPYPKFGVTR